MGLVAELEKNMFRKISWQHCASSTKVAHLIKPHSETSSEISAFWYEDKLMWENPSPEDLSVI